MWDRWDGLSPRKQLLTVFRARKPEVYMVYIAQRGQGWDVSVVPVPRIHLTLVAFSTIRWVVIGMMG